MKVLTVKNPWAFLIAKGIKDIENRTWKTNYRGKLLIHTSKEPVKTNNSFLDLFTSNQLLVLKDLHIKFNLNKMVNSSIIGEVELIDCIQNSKSIWAESNQYHWVLDNPVFYTHYIPDVKGKLGIWDYPITEEELEELRSF